MFLVASHECALEQQATTSLEPPCAGLSGAPRRFSRLGPRPFETFLPICVLSSFLREARKMSDKTKSFIPIAVSVLGLLVQLYWIVLQIRHWREPNADYMALLINAVVTVVLWVILGCLVWSNWHVHRSRHRVQQGYSLNCGHRGRLWLIPTNGSITTTGITIRRAYLSTIRLGPSSASRGPSSMQNFTGSRSWRGI